jgi:hypothetical protein
MDDYPYATLGASGWLHCNGLHRFGLPTLLWDVLHRFGCTGTPAYHSCLYREFGHGHCEVHVDIPAHPFDPGLTAWLTMATSDDLDDTLERATNQALTEFCGRHLSGLIGTTIALFPVQNDGDTAWSELLATVGDPECPTYHVGWAFMAHYTQHVSSMLQEVMETGTYQHLCLE